MNTKKYINYTTYTDTDAYEVIEFKSPKTAVVRLLDAERTNQDEDKFVAGGFCGHTSHGVNGQQWKFTSNEDRGTGIMTLRKNGSWQFKGQPMSRRGLRGSLSDEPYKYYDYNF